MIKKISRKTKEAYCKIATVVTKRVHVVDVTGTILTPCDNGEGCKGNGEHKNLFGKPIECCCDECDYYLLCFKQYSAYPFVHK